MADFLAFDQSFKGGVFVATGWIKGFSFADVIVGAGPGSSQVSIFSSNLTAMGPMMDLNNTVDLAKWNQISVQGFTTGLHVAGRFDADGTGDDLLVAPGPSNAPTVAIYKTNTLASDGMFQPFPPSHKGGVNFGASGRTDE
jgi:hypothetical protein